jgi:pimeloyl-ACP methyl ester carboxylesterase
MTTITPFRIEVSDEAIADLKERLAMTRWPQQTGPDWDRGQALGFVRELADEWQNRFDWRAAEAKLNRYPQFLTEVDGQTIHFVHVKSRHAGALPLILTHGWPATFTEYFALIEPLTNPADGGQAYDVVIPSLPGFGFSMPLSGPGWGSARVAKAWDTLMKRLGYTRYGAVGNDVGSAVVKELGVLAPNGLAGIHMQQIFAFPQDPEAWTKLDAFEQAGMANMEGWQKNNGYQRIQQSRPGTLAYGLSDSPTGLLAWLAELPFGFDGSSAQRYDRTHFLTDASIYWFTNTGGSAANIYLEDFAANGGADENKVTLPVGVAVFPEDFRSVLAHSAVNNNIVHWTQMPDGGHFAAVTHPELLARDVRAFFGGLG